MLPTAPLPEPVVPKSAEAPSPGQAGGTDPAFKAGGKVDPRNAGEHPIATPAPRSLPRSRQTDRAVGSERVHFASTIPHNGCLHRLNRPRSTTRPMPAPGHECDA
jgi:hypothetical protein